MSNNNNRNNNRRRGRGNNRSQGGGNLNRVDSRARGNAPQLLEKYKKLAHDAALNGDRVQAEYYLQFADHYFRVLADSRTQKDEQRGPRQFDREGGDDQDYFEDEFDRGQRQEPRRREEQASDDADGANEAPRQTESAEVEGDAYEPADNPFTRPAREKPARAKAPREDRPREDKPREDKPRRARRERDADGDDDSGNRLDPSLLPGSIGRSEEVSDEAEPAAEEREERAPARRSLKPRRSARARGNDDDEELEAVG